MNDDLIRRSDVLAEIEKYEKEGPGMDFSEFRKMIARMPVVSPGVPEEVFEKMREEAHMRYEQWVEAEEQLAELKSKDWRLYEKVMGDCREYRYGPEWVAQQLFMEGGYPTPEEAKLAWLRSEGERGER